MIIWLWLFGSFDSIITVHFKEEAWLMEADVDKLIERLITFSSRLTLFI
jgi:hypothetical protein